MNRATTAFPFLFLVLFAVVCSSAFPAATTWKLGEHYELLPKSAHREHAEEQIETTEVFLYSCPHCADLEPRLEHWVRSKPAYVRFNRIPLVYDDASRAYARLFYALQALHRDDLQNAAFQAVKADKHLLYAKGNEAETRRMHAMFATSHGIAADDFASAIDSPMVARNVEQAARWALENQIDAIPTFTVNGKYKTNSGVAGGLDEMLVLVDYLIASERSAVVARRGVSRSSAAPERPNGG